MRYFSLITFLEDPVNKLEQELYKRLCLFDRKIFTDLEKVMDFYEKIRQIRQDLEAKYPQFSPPGVAYKHWPEQGKIEIRYANALCSFYAEKSGGKNILAQVAGAKGDLLDVVLFCLSPDLYAPGAVVASKEFSGSIRKANRKERLEVIQSIISEELNREVTHD